MNESKERLERCRAPFDEPDLSAQLDTIRRVVRAVMCGIGNQSLADWDDVVQIVSMRLVEKLDEGRVSTLGGQLTSYVAAMAKNAALDWARRRRHECVVSQPPEPTPAELRPFLESQCSSIDLYLAALEPELRRLFQLRFERDYSLAETARLLGLSRQRARTLEKRLKVGALARVAPETS
jgi:RNA polymerase sigma factor (sigma-70 family)